MRVTGCTATMSRGAAARSWIGAVAALALTACGGGGSGGSNNTNNTGNVSVGGDPGNNARLVVGQLTFALPAQPVNEAAATATITISPTGSITSTISGSVMPSSGTATNGVDYSLVGATSFSFSPSDTAAKTITLSIVNDASDEPDESASLTFNFGDGTSTNIATVSVIIADDDAGPAGTPGVAASAAGVAQDVSLLQSRSSAARGGTISSPGSVTGTSLLATNYLKSSDTDADAMLGSAMAVATANGKIIAAVGAPAENGNVGGVYVFTAPASGDAPPAATRITPPVAQAMRFGYAVQLSRDGNTLAVGAPDESNYQSGIGSYPDMPNGDAPKSGAVFLYSRTNGAWSETPVYVKAIDVDAQDAFGAAIALSAAGDVLVVGAPGQDSATNQIDDVANGAVDSGAAYVSVLKQGTWSMLNGLLKAAHVGSGDKFGSAVAVAPRGMAIAVGAPYEDGIAIGGELKPNSGAAYLFTPANIKAGPDLLIERTLRFKAANGSAEDLFGKSVALGMDGKVLTVSARLGTAVALSVDGNTLLVGGGEEVIR